LFPLLFLLVMEVFTRIIDSTSNNGLISGFSVGRSNLTAIMTLVFVIIIVSTWLNLCCVLLGLRRFQI